MENIQQIQADMGAFRGSLEAPAVETIKYFIYARKSSEAEDRQVASIGSQIDELTKIAKEQGMEIIETFSEAMSAKAPGRPVLNEMLNKIHGGVASGILCWKLDRLARNPVDGGTISWMIQKGAIKHIQTYGRGYYPTDNVLMMSVEFGMANQFVRDLSEGVKRGLRAKCSTGWRPGVSPIGYVHDKFAIKGQKRIIVDLERAPIVKQMFERVAYENVSGRDLLTWLNTGVNFTTRSGKRISLGGIYRLLKETFYYGEFEYPVGSGKFYKGLHDPIIDKNLFLKAQANLLAPPRRHPGTNEFAFTRLFYCGACGAGITAEEKFKHQKNGNTHRYVYYHCSKGVDRYCKEKPIREEELLNQLLQIIDRIDVDEIGIKDKIRQEINKYKKFSYSVLGQETDFGKRPIETDIRNYAKYVLMNGTKDEKRELLSCLRSRIELKNKYIYTKVEASQN